MVLRRGLCVPVSPDEGQFGVLGADAGAERDQSWLNWGVGQAEAHGAEGGFCEQSRGGDEFAEVVEDGTVGEAHQKLFAGVLDAHLQPGDSVADLVDVQAFDLGWVQGFAGFVFVAGDELGF